MGCGGGRDGRWSHSDKAGLDGEGGTWGRRLYRLIRAGLERAAVLGVTRATIASRLERSPRTIMAWLEPGRTNLIPAHVLFELLAREDILPDEVRSQLCGALARECGYVLVRDDRADVDESPAAEQVTEIAAALGRVAEMVLTKTAAASPGGAELTRDEAASIEQETLRLQGQVTELLVAVRRVRGCEP